MNPFQIASCSALDAAEAMCSEPFTVIRNGIPGTYNAVSIDELTVTSLRIPGGEASGATDAMYVRQTVMDAAGLAVGTVLTMRGRKVRVLAMNDDGDGVQHVECGPVSGEKP